jgi:NAD(P)-dependent dehydrogenase (short-subunit alcohol dehydrogenase family)
MRSDSRLEGRVAIVTGGSSGIGLAIADVLARHGARVVVVGRNDEHICKAVNAINGGNSAFAVGFRLDVRSESDMNTMVVRTVDHFGRVDILIACAGIGKGRGSKNSVPRPLSHCSIEEFDEIVDVNLRGVFLSNRAVLPAMIPRGRGEIVNISSSPGGIYGQPFSAAYCASKFGVNGLSEALAAEVRPLGIRVQVVFPDATDTPLISHTTLAAQLGPPLSPNRIAYHVLFLVTAPRLTTWPGGSSVLRRASSDSGREVNRR